MKKKARATSRVAKHVKKHVKKHVTPTNAKFANQNPVQQAVIIGQEVGAAYRATANSVKTTRKATATGYQKTKAAAEAARKRAQQMAAATQRGIDAVDERIRGPVKVGAYTKTDGTRVKSHTRGTK